MKIFKSFIAIAFLMMVNIGLIYANIIESDVFPPGSLLPKSSSDTGDSIASIIAWMIGLSAVLTIMAVTWAGINMVLAVGEEEKMKKARHTMIYAFVGLIISGLAYGVVTFVTNLKLNSFL